MEIKRLYSLWASQPGIAPAGKRCHYHHHHHRICRSITDRHSPGHSFKGVRGEHACPSIVHHRADKGGSVFGVFATCLSVYPSSHPLPATRRCHPLSAPAFWLSIRGHTPPPPTHSSPIARPPQSLSRLRRNRCPAWIRGSVNARSGIAQPRTSCHCVTNG